ncbi:hypothetical protein [Bacillus alveayuensis]|uniref:hypothetical protein n=1 Tax=Aeribacillus alveayuensis TaxID=279215 RepID=UPI001F1E3408|nr:hypothetical protein [Bacillus alveayuensis]
MKAVGPINHKSSDLADIERLIQMMNDLEVKYKSFKKLAKAAMISRLFLFKYGAPF